MLALSRLLKTDHQLSHIGMGQRVSLTSHPFSARHSAVREELMPPPSSCRHRWWHRLLLTDPYRTARCNLTEGPTQTFLPRQVFVASAVPLKRLRVSAEHSGAKHSRAAAEALAVSELGDGRRNVGRETDAPGLVCVSLPGLLCGRSARR